MPDPENNNEFMAQYPHEGADPEANVEVSNKEYRDLFEFRKHFGKEFDHKTFDTKKWNELKDIDPADYKDMKGFVDVVESDEKIYDVVKEMIAAKREGRDPDFSGFTKAEVKAARTAAAQGAAGNEGKAAAAGQQGKNNQPAAQDPNSGLQQRIDRLEQERVNEKFWGSFDDVVKDMKMSEREKVLVEKLVLQTYRENKRLGLQDLKTTVEQLIKDEIQPLRDEFTNGRSKRLIDGEDKSPSMHGGGASIPGRKYDPTKASSEERVSQMRREMKEAEI